MFNGFLFDGRRLRAEGGEMARKGMARVGVGVYTFLRTLPSTPLKELFRGRGRAMWWSGRRRSLEVDWSPE